MKFVYQYRTSDNVKREGVISASSREAAFAALKDRGIKPGRVDVAPGLLNAVEQFVRRYSVLLVLCFIGLIAIPVIRIQTRVEYKPTPRHQIYGDPALMAELARENFSAVSDGRGDQFLLRYAQPGVSVVAPSADEVSVIARDLMADVSAHVRVRASDSREVRELKQILMWIKNEFSRFIDDGETAEEYIRRLAQRQAVEVKIYETTKTELQSAKSLVEWEKKNDLLRNLGLKTIPVPSSLE